MLYRYGVFLASTAAILAPLTVAAQPGSELQQDRQDFAIVEFGSGTEKSDGTGLASSLNIDKFRSHNLERVMRQDASLLGIPDRDFQNSSAKVIGKYHFGSGPLVPLVGLSMAYVYGDDVKDQFVAGPEVGLKYFLTPTTVLYGLVEYRFPLEGGNDIYDGQLVYGAGIGITFSYR